MNTSNVTNGTSLSADAIGGGHVSLLVYVISCLIVLFEFTSNALVIFILSTRKTLRKKRYTGIVTRCCRFCHIISRPSVASFTANRPTVGLSLWDNGRFIYARNFHVSLFYFRHLTKSLPHGNQYNLEQPNFWRWTKICSPVFP